MTRPYSQSAFLAKAVSPYGLALVSSAIFLLAWLFPPSAYSAYMEEPDYIFLNVTALALYSVCVMAFLLGVWLIDLFFPVGGLRDEKLVYRLSPVTFILVPLSLGLIFSVLSNVIIIRSTPDLLRLLLEQGGAELKTELQFQTPLGLAGVYLIGIVWWATWRCDQLDLRGGQRRMVKLFQYLATASVVLTTILKLVRGELMPVITGVAIIYLLRKSVHVRKQGAFAFKFFVIFASSVLVLFLLASFVRGTTNLTKDVFAYTIASYDRLAALLSGRLRYPYGGRGIYLFSFLGYNNMLNMIVPFRDILHWPSFMEYWQSEFRAMGPAGLSENAIWTGTFGYIYADIGWFAPLFVFFEGVLCGVVWRSIKLGRPLGIVLYPWFAFCILFWFGMNSLLENKLLPLVLDVIGLSLYELLCLRRENPVVVFAGPSLNRAHQTELGDCPI
jgi:hypothetical protein